MRKPVVYAKPMVTTSPTTRPWGSCDAELGHVGHVADVAVAAFGIQLRVQNGTVRLEGLGGGTG